MVYKMINNQIILAQKLNKLKFIMHFIKLI